MSEETTPETSSEEVTAAPAQSAPPAPKPDSIARLVLTLMLVALVAGAALAGAHKLTKARIAASRARVKLAGIQRVLPKCDNDPVKDALTLEGPEGRKTSIYRCRVKQPDGSLPVVAVAIERDSENNEHKPYSGLMRVLVGIDARTGRVRAFERKGAPDVGVVILKHTETPGLGSKAEAYAFLKAFAHRNLVGKNEATAPKKPEQRKVWATSKDKPGVGFVDAISGATITSRAVMELVRDALAVFNQHRETILNKVKGSQSDGGQGAGGDGSAGSGDGPDAKE
jgi:electron transport complex protein RnfG